MLKEPTLIIKPFNNSPNYLLNCLYLTFYKTNQEENYMNINLIEAATSYVQQLFENQLPKEYTYHNAAYTLDVKNAAITIGKKEGLSEEDINNIALSALFHRTGNTKGYWEYHKVSQDFAQDFLQQQNYPKEQLQKILSYIELVNQDKKPVTSAEKVLVDAINSDLGLKKFPKRSNALQMEQAHFLNQQEQPGVFIKKQEEEIKEQRFHTKAAKKIFKKQAKANRKKLKNKRKRQESKAVKAYRPLNGSSEARMMFKTALRNHIDLTNIADNKANIMLSINAIIITLAMPLLAGFIVKQPTLIYPLSVLLITCVVTVIFATMATRPIKMDGHTADKNIKSPSNNLFFFGNFYQIPLPKYQESIRAIIKDDVVLENSIINDLYYLGLALGNKFRLLRTCYLVFMVGITLSVLTFGVTLAFQPDPIDIESALEQLQQQMQNQQQNRQEVNPQEELEMSKEKLEQLQQEEN